MNSVITAEKLSKSLRVGFWGRQKQILHDISFKVPKGSIVGFIGPNGAGKSTTIKLLLGAMKPSHGTLEVLGMPPGATRAKAKVGYLPEIQNLPRTLRPVELLQLHLRLSGSRHAGDEAYANQLFQKVDLTPLKDQPIKGFSKGQQQRVGLALALCHNPEVLIMDEPMSGLDPIGRRVVRDIITEQKALGKSIFFSSHVLPDVEALCDEIILIHQGRTLAQGPMEDILNQKNSGYEITVTDLPDDLAQLPNDAQVRTRGATSVIRVRDQAACMALLEQVANSSACLQRVEAIKPTLENEVIALIETSQTEGPS